LVFPLRRFAQEARLYSVCRQTEPASHGVTRSFRVFVETRWHAYWLRAPLLPLAEAGLQGFRSSRWPGMLVKARSVILSWTYALLQSPPGIEPPPLRRSPEDGRFHRGSSHEVSLPYSVSPPGAAA
jgi:hypothetical protein